MTKIRYNLRKLEIGLGLELGLMLGMYMCWNGYVLVFNVGSTAEVLGLSCTPSRMTLTISA